LRLKSVEYKEHSNVHRRFKSFEVGDEKMVHLRKERYQRGTYSKLNVQKVGPCQIKRKFGENAYQVELPESFDNSPLFNVPRLYMYEAVEDDTMEDAKVDWHQMQKKKEK